MSFNFENTRSGEILNASLARTGIDPQNRDKIGAKQIPPSVKATAVCLLKTELITQYPGIFNSPAWILLNMTLEVLAPECHDGSEAAKEYGQMQRAFMADMRDLKAGKGPQK